MDSDSLLPKTNAAIAADLVALAAAFFEKNADLQATPFYVFTESYGGKMAATFAPALYAAIQAGAVKANFRGFVMGDSWIFGTDHVDAWCPFLRKVDLLDDAQYDACMVPTKSCDAATAAGDWQGAINAWGQSEGVISDLTDNVDFYNILVHGSAGDILMDANGNARPNSRRVKRELRLSDEALALAPAGVSHDALQTLYRNHLSVYLGDPLDALMNGPIRKKLGIIPANVTWGGQSGKVFSTLSLDFMKPVWADVDAALALDAFNVTVEEGQLDLICSAWGADLWMARLQWPGMPGYYAAPRTPRYPSAEAQSLGATSGFIKRSGRFARYDVLSAGHMGASATPPLYYALAPLCA